LHAHRARPHLPPGGGRGQRERAARRGRDGGRVVRPAPHRQRTYLAGLVADLARRRAAARRRPRHGAGAALRRARGGARRRGTGRGRLAHGGAARGRAARARAAGRGVGMTFVEQTWVTWLNVAAVLVGGGLGLLVRGRLAERVTVVIMQAIGLVTLLVGMLNALDLSRVDAPPGVLVGLLALAIGGALGEWWGIEDGLERLGERLKRALGGQGRFTEGFVAASLLFCVGPLTLLGSFQNGLTGEAPVLVLKSTLD